MAVAWRQVNKIPVSPSPGGVCAVVQLQGFWGMQKFFQSTQYSEVTEGTSGGELHQPSAQSWASLNYCCEWQSLHWTAVSGSGCPSHQHQSFVSESRHDAAPKEHSQFSKSKHICPTATPITSPGRLEGRWQPGLQGLEGFFSSLQREKLAKYIEHWTLFYLPMCCISAYKAPNMDYFCENIHWL